MASSQAWGESGTSDRAEGMSTRRKALLLVEPGTRLRWLGLAGLSLVVAGLEMVGAFLVLSLLQLLSGEGGLTLPVVGDLEALFPGASDESLLLGLLVFAAVFFAVRPLITLIQVYLQRRTEYVTGARISERLVAGYMEMPYEMHLQRNSAELTRNTLTSVQTVVTRFFAPLSRMLSEALTVIALLVVLALAAPIATLIAVAVIGLTVLFTLGVIHPRLTRLGGVDELTMSQALRVLNQTFSGMRDIRVFGKESAFLAQFARQRRRMARSRYRIATFSAIPRLTIETAIFLLVVAVLATTSLAGVGEQAVAVLGLFGYAAVRIMPSMNRIVSFLNRLKAGRAALDNVTADLLLVEREVARRDSAATDVLVEFDNEIRLEDVSFTYAGSDSRTLRNIDLTVPKGTSLGIVGPTGSGKTTLLDVILGLLPPAEGQVLVDDGDIQDRRRGWRRHLSIVPQVVFLIDDTLMRNIALGLPRKEIDEDKVLEAVRSAQLDDFVASLPDGLDTTVGEDGMRLSGGERQRVAIARALYKNPSVLIFDEGTSALDTVTETALLKAIESLMGEYTIISVAHRLSTVRNADQIALLVDGKIAAVGTYEELVSQSEIFREMAI